MKRTKNILHYINNLKGATWVNMFSIVMLVKFMLNVTIDGTQATIYLGILGMYAGHQVAVKGMGVEANEEKPVIKGE